MSKELLALNIIEDHFGGLTKDVASFLMKFAGATLLQLTNHYCRLVVPLLSKDSLCSSLLILQQHGCLITELPRGTTFAELDKAEELKRPIYSIDVDMVLHRLQIGRFIWHASRAVSAANIGEILVEELFMNGRQSFQHLLADVITRLSVGKSTFSLSGQAAADDASSTKVELIKVCFEELVEKGFIIASEKHKPNRRTVLTLPPKSKGAKNKRHLNLEHADTRKKRKLDDNNLNQDDDEEEEEDGEDDGGDAVNSEMQRLLHNSGARDTVNIFENRRFVGDGEWKEDTGFGPDTEEAVFDVEANDAARLLLAQHHQQQEEQEHYQRQQPHRASMELNVASDKGAATVGGLRGMIFKKEPKASIVQRKGVNVQAGGNGNDMDGDHDKESLQTFLAEPEKGICSDETMWTVGWAQMFVVERQNECVKYAKERMQIKAGRIMRILLDTLQLRSVKWDVTMPTELSAPMRLPTIFEEYKLAAETTSPGSPYHGGWERDGSNMASTVAEKPLDLPSLRKLLSSLTEDRCLTETNSGTGSDNIDYQANVGEIINRIKRKTIQSVAAQRFGLPAARIVELLVASDELIEQGRISDMAIMPAREARENLYKLYRDHWVDYQAFSKRLDYALNTTQFFWYADQIRLRASILDHCYRAVLNMRVKMRELSAECDTADMQVVSRREVEGAQGDDKKDESSALESLHAGEVVPGDGDDKTPVSSHPAEVAMRRVEKLERAILGVDRTVRILTM